MDFYSGLRFADYLRTVYDVRNPYAGRKGPAAGVPLTGRLTVTTYP
jgi:hypothetical protein